MSWLRLSPIPEASPGSASFMKVAVNLAARMLKQKGTKPSPLALGTIPFASDCSSNWSFVMTFHPNAMLTYSRIVQSTTKTHWKSV